MAIKITINPPSKIADRICNNDALGIFVAETCAKYMDDYVPMDTGMLAQNYNTEPFKVIYTSIYAHRLLDGIGFHFDKEKHPLATSHWEQATSNARGNMIAQDITNYLRRVGK